MARSAPRPPRPWLVLAAALALAAPAAAGEARYRVAFSGAERRVVHVDAELSTAGRELLMSPVGAHHLEGRWSRFVEDLEARDARGREVRLEDGGDGSWRVRGRPPGELHLSWRVRLDHDLEPWPTGWDAAAYLLDDCTYLATDVLLIAAPDVGRARIAFEVPRGWKVSAPWLEVPGEPWEFEVRGFESLTHTALVVGEHTERRLRAGGAEWILALGERFGDSADVVGAALEQLVGEAAMIFGELPGERFLLVANRADYNGGAAHRDAVSMLFERPPREGDALWSYVLAHELIHLWNGIAIRRRSAGMEWFAEGVTDYLAVLIQARAGLARPEDVFERLATSHRMYAGTAREHSLAAAGDDKLGNADLVYGGGFWMGLLLDLELRRASGGERSLEDLMRALYVATRDAGQGAYGLDDLRRAANEVAGESLTRFFQRHVEGRQPIPVGAYLARLGLEVAESGRGRRRRSVVRRRDEVDPRQVALRRAILAVE